MRLSEQDLRNQRANGGISVPIADFLIKAGAESSDVREYRRLLNIDEKLAADSYHFRRVQAEVVSGDLLDRWIECKKKRERHHPQCKRDISRRFKASICCQC